MAYTSLLCPCTPSCLWTNAQFNQQCPLAALTHAHTQCSSQTLWFSSSSLLYYTIFLPCGAFAIRVAARYCSLPSTPQSAPSPSIFMLMPASAAWKRWATTNGQILRSTEGPILAKRGALSTMREPWTCVDDAAQNSKYIYVCVGVCSQGFIVSTKVRQRAKALGAACRGVKTECASGCCCCCAEMKMTSA